ncbi:PaREP1 family protein [Vulcanisaeta souniana]|uniref:PaREP1 family protein n=1 Tax=Vulcanisaeta souniana TaxID=164452 RepID=UPI000ABF6720|nr:PaREP1 family protein [Vulcanisaeta souniana]
MEVGYLDYKRDPVAHVYAKVLDDLVEARLALEMLGRDLIQNASAKAFMSVKSIVSALVVKNLPKSLKGGWMRGGGLGMRTRVTQHQPLG